MEACGVRDLEMGDLMGDFEVEILLVRELESWGTSSGLGHLTRRELQDRGSRRWKSPMRSGHLEEGWSL